MLSTTTSVLIVGVGSIGERHVRCFQSTGRADVSICEVNDSLRRQIADRYGINQDFERFEEALRAPHNAVVIATPAHLHVPMAQAACDAGLHLLIEKPLSTTLEGVDQLQESAARKDRIVAVAYVYRAHPALAAMRQAIAEDRFGQPLQIVTVAGQHFPLYRPAYRETYYVDHATGGGAVQDALTHLINAAEWLVGPVTQLVADADHLHVEGVTVEDTVQVLARHGDVLGSYSLNQHQAPNECTITVICENATARFEYHRSRWMSMEQPETPWCEESSEPLERDALFVMQANRFLDAVDGRAGPLCSLGEGVQTLRCNLAILDSIKHRAWRSIPAQ